MKRIFLFVSFYLILAHNFPSYFSLFYYKEVTEKPYEIDKVYQVYQDVKGGKLVYVNLVKIKNEKSFDIKIFSDKTLDVGESLCLDNKNFIRECRNYLKYSTLTYLVFGLSFLTVIVMFMRLL